MREPREATIIDHNLLYELFQANFRNGTLCCVESIKINFNGDTDGWKRDQVMFFIEQV
jgi:hypothetical protein